jgi:hypothetical protein
LSISAITTAVGLLRYLSITENLGKLIIMIIAMIMDLKDFAIIFSLFLFGFFVAMHGLMRSSEAYNNPVSSLQTLFSSALSNYDSTFLTLTEPSRCESLD